MGLKETLGVNEFKTKNHSLWKALLAEFIGNTLLNFFGCGACITGATPGVNVLIIALSFGLTIFVVVQAIGHVSGAHINPAVTVAMMITQNISILKGLLYIIVQLIGAIAGSGLLRAVANDGIPSDKLGVTSLQGITAGQGLLLEVMLGFVLILTVFGVCDSNRHEAKPAAALAIGLAVSICHLVAVDKTGSSINPARSFGSAVIGNSWEEHWIYWVGPILGGIIASLIYKYVFSAPSTGPLKIIERYTAVVADEKELKRLDGSKHDISLP